ncbi:hypothetical protein Salat_0769800 [Sesamum alatum]|uniref:Uncharacterized protein n=1 Tax=Sesamum alatum TaxID=300844 RepID=A0AAE1YTU1_9LAMI|nr:hypothetical protein Salat_0769800 [Sesamum alatum]
MTSTKFFFFLPLSKTNSGESSENENHQPTVTQIGSVLCDEGRTQQPPSTRPCSTSLQEPEAKLTHRANQVVKLGTPPGQNTKQPSCLSLRPIHTLNNRNSRAKLGQ